MSFDQELADFSTTFDKTNKRLGEKSKKKTATADATAATAAAPVVEAPKDLVPPPVRTDQIDKGYGYREGGIVRPKPWSWAKAKR